MARLRNASQQPASLASTRQALKEKTNTSQIPLYSDDGETEGLVKNVKKRRGRPKKVIQQEPDEFMMAGGLGRSIGDAPTTTDELAKSDSALPPAAKPNRKPPRTAKKVAQSETQSKVLEGLKMRMEATARGQRAKNPVVVATATSDAPIQSSDSLSTKADLPLLDDVMGERSELSLSTSPPPPGKLSAAKGPRSSLAVPGSILRAQSTPAIESSLLALKNFKRRPRQPSMLQMVQQRTASARPSIAYTAQENTAAEDDSVFDLALDTDEEDGFTPEAEGTPLHAAKKLRTSSGKTKRKAPAGSKVTKSQAMPAAKKRKSDQVEEGYESLEAINTKRARTVSSIDDGDDALPPLHDEAIVTRSSLSRVGTPLPAITSDIQVINSSSTSTPTTEPPSPDGYTAPKNDDFVIPSTERDERNEQLAGKNNIPDDDDHESNGTLADPLSSSPARKGDPPLMDDPLAYPVTQVSPTALAKPRLRKKPKPVSTFVLQSLLPKRRLPLQPRHRKSEYDLQSASDDDSPLDFSYLEDDEDELGGSLRRQTKTVPTRASKKTGAKKTTLNNKASPSTTRKSSAIRKDKSSTANSKEGPRTYGRTAATASDKENDDAYESSEEEEGDANESALPDVSISMQEAAESKELADAKRKFAEVDDWDMEFESMSADQHRSSSQDWR